MSRTVNVNEEIIVVSHGEEDTGKMAMLGAEGKFHKSVIPVIDDLQEQITKEVTERTKADKQLQDNIDAEAAARKNADKDLQDKLDAEVNARKDADNQLQTNIDAEVDDRTKADQDLQDKLDAEIVARTKGDETEANERDSTDKNLQEQIDLLKGKNAFSKIVVGDSTIEADNQTDTIELGAGTNIALTADTINDKVTIAVTGKVASAQQADTATKLETARNINGVPFDGTSNITVPTMPIGSMIMWASSTLPAGNDEGKWLECNGQSTDGYPELAAIVGANVPDYRGCFLRGAGSVTSNHFGKVTHSSGALGELQGDSIRNIYGNIGPIQFVQAHLQHTGGAFYATQDNTYGWGESAFNSKDYTTNFGQGYFPLWLDASKIVPTAEENRPINKAVIYLIKAK